jgi:hypothetical protein
MPRIMPGDSFYREAPFWSWNDALTKREAIRQIDLMAKAGWGGFFMHARVGLITPYMGKEWMDVTKACIAHANKRRMCAYLYDENKWPSGFAGGEVPEKGPEYRSKFLMMSENVLEEGPAYKWLSSVAMKRIGGRVEVATLARGQRAPAGTTALHFYQYTMQLGNEWFLGSAYVDLLDPAVTKEFIRVTHERYRKLVGREFGGIIPAIFTDEPSLPFSESCPGPSVPWTGRMGEEFLKRRGYHVIPHLASIFLPVGNWREIRYDFYRTVRELFVEGFAKQIGQWCEKQGFALTGHMMAEDTLEEQMRFSGGVMPFYEYFQIPGIDHLGNNVKNPATAKQVSSVADQLGKRRVISELYGCSGQDFNLKGRKWIADWHLALGINLLNPHLWLYTMRGARKRDFPPNIGFQQPHFAKWRALSDRNARLSKLLSTGRRVVDTLVIHPIESGWCITSPLEPSAIDALDASYKGLVDELLSRHIDFHFADEELLARFGSVKSGIFSVGKCRYKAIVVAETLTLRRSTLSFLDAFARAGGAVFVVNRAPLLVEGVPGRSAVRHALARAKVVKLRSVANALSAAAKPAVAIEGTNAAKVFYHLRDLGGKRLLFVANTDYTRPADVRIAIRTGDKSVTSVDLPGDAPRIVAARTRGSTLVFDVALAEAGSALFELSAAVSAKAGADRPAAGKLINIRGPWRISRMDDNALTVDYVRLPHKSHGWTGPEYVLFAAEKFKGRNARARYEFTVDHMPRGPIQIAIERPEDVAISVNGAPVASRPRGYFVDTEFKRIDVTRHVRPGRNVVDIRCGNTEGFELESIYVLGNFGVHKKGKEFVVAASPDKVDPRDLSTSGLQFFAGVVDVETDIRLDRAPRSATVILGELRAGAAEVFVNGRAQGDLLWPPYEVPVKGLRRGRNVIRLRLYSTLRNLLGPHHFEGPEIEWVSPGSFKDRKRWTDEYRFLPFGITGAVLATD